jgi:hypothetical protein
VPYTHAFFLKLLFLRLIIFLTVVVFFESPFQAISGRSYELPIKPNKPLQMRVFAETPSSNISEIN